MRPKYTAHPIGSPKALAATLGLTEATLTDLASSVATQYSHFSIPKANGKLRAVCSPSFHLKIVQKRINHSIFGNVIYPDYLFGGIAGRDYVQNAQIHSDAAALIALDIRDFYPNIERKRVVEVFKHFCRFPTEVSELLAQLTTLDGTVPQGACTSSHIANLVLHDVEHRVVREFQLQKLTYSRLLDDICISSASSLPQGRIDAIVAKIRQMLLYKGFKLRQSKTRITSASNPEDLMEVTGLWLNRGKPRVHRQDRRDIRAAVHRCEALALISRTSPDYHREHDKISGRVSKLSHLGHFEAANYRARLSKILPTYDQSDVNKSLRLVRVLSASKPSDRGTHSYFDRFHAAQYRLGILGRSHPGLAALERAKLEAVQPTKTRFELIYGDNP